MPSAIILDSLGVNPGVVLRYIRYCITPFVAVAADQERFTELPLAVAVRFWTWERMGATGADTVMIVYTKLL